MDADTTIKFYLVGGKNRDDIMGFTNNDLDYAVECSSYEYLLKYLTTIGAKIYKSDPIYLSIRCRLETLGNVDLVICRKDGKYHDKRHPQHTEIGTIYDDLARRDLTINAIAKDISNNNYIDPYNGYDDIVNHNIKCVGNASDRLSEDALRMVRILRFYIILSTKTGIMWNIDPEILQYIAKNYSEISYISRERIYEEYKKIFDEVNILSFFAYCNRYTELTNLVNLIFQQYIRLTKIIKTEIQDNI